MGKYLTLHHTRLVCLLFYDNFLPPLPLPSFLHARLAQDGTEKGMRWKRTWIKIAFYFIAVPWSRTRSCPLRRLWPHPNPLLPTPHHFTTPVPLPLSGLCIIMTPLHGSSGLSTSSLQAQCQTSCGLAISHASSLACEIGTDTDNAPSQCTVHWPSLSQFSTFTLLTWLPTVIITVQTVTGNKNKLCFIT